MTLGEFARPEFERRRDLLEKALIQSMMLPDVEAVHKVRTSWRRLEAAVKLLPWLVPKRRWEVFRQKMKAVMSASAELRDRDNAMELLRVYSPLCAAIQGQRRLWEAEYHSRAELMFPFVVPLRASYPLEANSDAAAQAELVLADVANKIQAERAKLGPKSKSDEWHQFRILTKRQRYSLEFFTTLKPEYEYDIVFVKDRQDKLGEVEDVVAAIRVARAAAPIKKLIREPLEHLEAELREKVGMLDDLVRI